MNTRLLIVATLTAVLLLGLLPGCRDSSEEGATGAQESGRPRAVRVVAPVEEEILRSLDYVGTVHSGQDVQVLSRVAATITEVFVDEGDEVSRGTPLVRMEAPEFDARADRLRAEIARVRTEKDFQCETAATDRALAEEGMLTRAQADASHSRCLASAEAQRAAQAALSEAEESRRRLRESAPIDGVLLQRFVEPGEYVAPGRPLFRIGAGALELRVSVTEVDIQAGLAPGAEALVRTAHHRGRGTISRIAPMARGPGRTVEVRLTLPDALAATMRPGMSVDVSFILEENSDALTLPREAILDVADESFVFVIDGDRLRRIVVETGIRADGRVEVSSPNVGPDSRVVLGGLEGLDDGEAVYPVDTTGRGRR